MAAGTAGRSGGTVAPVVAGGSRSIAVRAETSPALAARLRAGRHAAGSECRDLFSAFFRIMLMRKYALPGRSAAPSVGWGALRFGQVRVFFHGYRAAGALAAEPGKALEHRCYFDGQSCSTAPGSAESLKCHLFKVRCFLALISVISDLQ